MNIIYLDLLFSFVDSLKWVVLLLFVYCKSKDKIHTLLDNARFSYGGASIDLSANKQLENQEKKVDIINNNDSNKIGPVSIESELAELREEKRFNNIYVTLFKSQIKFLKELSSKINLSTKELIVFFDEVKNSNSIYEESGWDYVKYVAFMKESMLIEQNHDFIKLTDYGRKFLMYTIKNVYTGVEKIDL